MARCHRLGKIQLELGDFSSWGRTSPGAQVLILSTNREKLDDGHSRLLFF